MWLELLLIVQLFQLQEIAEFETVPNIQLVKHMPNPMANHSFHITQASTQGLTLMSRLSKFQPTANSRLKSLNSMASLLVSTSHH